MTISDSLRRDLEHKAAKRVAAEEKRSGYRQGTWRQKQADGSFRHVRVEVVFHPKTGWFVTNLSADLLSLDKNTRRKLTPEEWATLEPWL